MKKSFICIAILLASVSLYAQFNVSYGFDAGYSTATAEIDLPQNPDDEIGLLYSGGGLDLSYAIPNGLTFGLRGALLTSLVELRKVENATSVLENLSFGVGYKAGLGIGYTHTSKDPYQLSVSLFPVTISYVFTEHMYALDNTFFGNSVEELVSIMNYGTGVQFSYIRLNHSKKFGNTWTIGLDVLWGLQMGPTLEEADFYKQTGVDLSFSYKWTTLF